MTKEWNKHRATILEYYQHKAMPLLKVMDVMKRDHNFSASQRAYRQQFQKWNVFKYNRKSRPLDSHYPYSPFHRSRTPPSYTSPMSLTPRTYYEPRVALPNSAGTSTRPSLPSLTSHRFPSYSLASPPTTSSSYMSAYNPYTPTHDVKLQQLQQQPASLDSSPASCLGHSSLDNNNNNHNHSSNNNRSYSNDTDAYRTLYPLPSTSSQSHHTDSYEQPTSYYTQTETSPGVYSPSDCMTGMQGHSMDRYGSHSQSSHGASSSPSQYDSPPKYSPREAADHTPSAYSTHAGSLPHQTHAHLPTQYQQPMYTQPVGVLG